MLLKVQGRIRYVNKDLVHQHKKDSSGESRKYTGKEKLGRVLFKSFQ